MERNFAIQQEKKRVNTIIYGIVICWGILAILFGVLDLQISQLLVDPQSDWARWIADYGGLPGAFMIISSLLILDRLRPPIGAKTDALISLLLSITVTILIVRYGTPFAKKYEFLQVHAIFFIPLIGLAVILLQKLLKQINVSYIRSFQNFALITVGLAILSPLLIVQTLKFIWDRVRFRDLAPDHSNFTPWYHPQWINGHSSFPSGHTAMGWMLLPLFLLVLNKSWRTKLLTGSGIIGWGVLVALGRVVIGAHYASDVLFSTGVAFVCYLFLYNRLYLQLAIKEPH